MKVLVFNVDNWLSTARMPKALQNAGFEVATLCPNETFLSKTRYVNRRFTIPSLNPQVVAAHFIQAMHEWRPQLVIVGDERVLWFLHRVVIAADAGQDIGLDAEAIECVRHSLPERKHFEASVDKFTFHALADRLGVRVPRYHIVQTMADSLGFAESSGYPVVFKNGLGTGGAGVTICQNEEQLVKATSESSQFIARSPASGKKMTVEQYIKGQICSTATAFYRGELVASVLCDKTECHPAITGPSTVRRYFEMPEVDEFVATILKETGFSGFCGFDFIVEHETGLPYVVEWNARVTPPCSIGMQCGVDLCKALFAKMSGEPVPPMKVIEGWMMAYYPQELVRDPNSTYVDRIYHDVPVNDPDLLKAFEGYIRARTTPPRVGQPI